MEREGELSQCSCQGRDARPGRDRWTFGSVYSTGARAAEEAAYASVPMALRAEALLGGRENEGGFFGEKHVH